MNKEIFLNNLFCFSYIVFCYLSIKLLIFKKETLYLKEAIRSLFYYSKNPGKLNFINSEINSIWNSVYSLNFKNKNEVQQNSIYNDILSLGTSITSSIEQSSKVARAVAEIILRKTTAEVTTVAIFKYCKENTKFNIEYLSGATDQRLLPIITWQLEEFFSKSRLEGNFNNWGYQFTTNGEKFDLSPLGINLSLAVPLEINNNLIAAIWLGFKNHTAILDPEKAALIKGICEHCAASLKVSESVKSNIELYKLERDVLLDISHDLKMPGNCALYAVNELEETLMRGSKKQKNLLSILKNSLEQQLEQIDNILDFSKKQAGVLRANKVKINLKQEIEELFKSYAVCSNQNIKLICEEVPDIKIQFDPLNFRRIISNLLSNAFKYTKQGEVRIRFLYDLQNLKIQIIDTGIGIPEKELPDLFQKFNRLKNSTKISGTGLGLSCAYNLAELNNANLVYRANLPQGSIFELNVALAEKTANSKVFFEKVLVVDDDILICKTIKRYLKEFTTETLVAVNCEDAIKIIESQKIDLLISDINLENTTIEIVLNYLLKENLRLPIILISGEINLELVEKYKNYFDLNSLQKPISRNSLTAYLEGFS